MALFVVARHIGNRTTLRFVKSSLSYIQFLRILLVCASGKRMMKTTGRTIADNVWFAYFRAMKIT
jgi:hypothetical protein